MEARTPAPADLGQIRAAVDRLGLGEAGVQEFGDANSVLLRLPVQGEEAQTQQAVNRVRATLEQLAPARASCGWTRWATASRTSCS